MRLLWQSASRYRRHHCRHRTIPLFYFPLLGQTCLATVERRAAIQFTKETRGISNRPPYRLEDIVKLPDGAFLFALNTCDPYARSIYSLGTPYRCSILRKLSERTDGMST